MPDKDSASSDELSNELNSQFAALGEYIAMCSLLEAMLHICLMTWLKIDGEVKRMLVGEPRIGDLLELTKKAARRAGYAGEGMAFIEALHAIAVDNNKIRQIVAHKPMAPSRALDGKMTFHNYVTAKTRDSRYMYECTREELLNQAALIQECSACWTGMLILDDDDPVTLGNIKTLRGRLASLQSNPLPKIPSPPPPPKPPKQPPQPPPSPA